ncbi:MAG TPA: hypothetical protein VMB03_08965 [Bryobacteraceae bacterium]|nr:hypothetical protein [Bryobacteraceae bacterium]
MGRPTPEQLKKMKRECEERIKLLKTAASRQRARLAKVDHLIAANRQRLMDKTTDKFIVTVDRKLHLYRQILARESPLLEKRMDARVDETRDPEAISLLHTQINALTKEISKLEWEAVGVGLEIQRALQALADFIHRNDKLLTKETREKAVRHIEATLKELHDPTGLGSFPHALLRTR